MKMNNFFRDGLEQRERDKKFFLDMKFDVEEILDKLMKWENDFNFRLWMKGDEEYSREKYFLQLSEEDEYDKESEESDVCECSEISVLLRGIRPSFVGPAYNFNKYMDAYVNDVFWNDIKCTIEEDEWISSSLREAMIIMELQNCLMSIKMGLDRMVKLFATYYKGISLSSTFGHIEIKEDGTEKGTGLMSCVLKNREIDELFELIYSEYNDWIKQCVEPRDTITHYQDFCSTYFFDGKTGIEYPIHLNEKKNKPTNMSVVSMHEYVEKYYVLYNKVLEIFIKKEKK